jgi:hypothetical protein
MRLAVSPAPPTYMVVRSDDGGTSHSLDMALHPLIATGLSVSVSVMVPALSYQGELDALRRRGSRMPSAPTE